ncbi:MAG: glycoside hydrolase family 2 protein [Bacteroidales bacterium]
MNTRRTFSRISGAFCLVILFSCSNTSVKNHEEMIEINQNWSFSEKGKNQWMEAVVPGCVHTDLIRNGIIEDPFFRLNEHDVQWIDKTDWIYKTSIEVPRALMEKQKIVLCFEGLDTYAGVFLNGQLILETDNMFRDWEVDVKEILLPGSNELKVLLHSPVLRGIELYDNYPHRLETSDNDLAKIGQVPGEKHVSPYVRKAQCHFGWDWGPRLVTSGIWKPVRLIAWNGARIVDLNIVQNTLDDNLATLSGIFEIKSEETLTGTLSMAVNQSTVATKKVEIQKGNHTYMVNFEIKNPRRWWTNGLGEPYLYDVSGVLETGEGVQQVSHNTGLRTFEVVREKDKDGTSFYMKLNGHPLFMKGANYIPGDAFPDRVTPEKYEKIILTAKECNFNMLRVWGGGIYEKDIFYDLCDKHGLLVWQDFMFACNMYPGHPEFLESVGREAADNIKRLRNHPSIALWCGNNEVLSAWWLWGWKEKAEKENKAGADAQWKAYKDIFLDILPGAVARYDPGRFYWGSSPQSGDTIPEDLANGDSHYWGVWWGKEPFGRYHSYLARFMSEYGFQSFPELKTVKQYAVEEDFDIYSDVMQSHQRSSIGNVTIETYMLRDYRKPADFESYLYLSHVLQAEGVKKAMEGHRIAMPYTMGSLYWQINDCWPVASWSSTDYYVRWKALQYYSKKAFAEVLVAPRNEDGILKVHVVSDRLTPFKAILSLKLLDFSGETSWSEERTIEVASITSALHFEIPVNELLGSNDASQVLLVAKLLEKGMEVSSNLFYFVPVKEIELPEPEITLAANQTENGYLLELRTGHLAKNVYLSMDQEGFFSDNYFDLLPGESRVIDLTTATTGDITQKIRVRSIRDTYLEAIPE